MEVALGNRTRVERIHSIVPVLLGQIRVDEVSCAAASRDRRDSESPQPLPPRWRQVFPTRPPEPEPLNGREESQRGTAVPPLWRAET